MRRSRWVLLLALTLGLVLAFTLLGCSGSSGGGYGSSGGTTGGGTTGGGTTGGGGGYGYTPPSGGGSTGGTTSGTGTTIDEKNFSFNPSSLTAKVGDTITFTNSDSTQHHVVVGTTDLGIQNPGATVTFKATKAGTLPIKCLIHPSMTGQIIVK